MLAPVAAVALVVSAAGYGLLVPSLAAAAFVSLPLLLLWITGVRAVAVVPRAGLTHERIAVTAAEVADEVGLERLTLAAVAQRLGERPARRSTSTGPASTNCSATSRCWRCAS